MLKGGYIAAVIHKQHPHILMNTGAKHIAVTQRHLQCYECTTHMLLMQQIGHL